MKVIDSSGWIEYFTQGPLGRQYAERLSDLSQVITPTIILYEVYKKIRKTVGEEAALLAATEIQRTNIVPLSADIAILAADTSLQHDLGMADAIVLATAYATGAELVTSDSDFSGLPGVTYLAKANG